MKISIIIPTKNSAKTLGPLFSSIIMQNDVDYEIIVVDNNSEDDTVEIALNYGAKVLSYNCERSKARNIGASNSVGNYVLFLDSDMELSEGLLNNCINKINDGLYESLIIREITRGEGYWAKVRSLERKTYEGDSYYETAIFFKRDVFLKLGGFDEDLIGFEDYDLQERLELNNIKTGYMKTPIIHNEGPLCLKKHLLKKMYYVKTGKKYIYQNRKRSFLQLQPFRRSFFRNWKVLLKNPELTIGIIILKIMESISGLMGLLS